MLGVMAAVICYYAIQLVKRKLHIDDSLDVFAVHGVGGILGSIMLAFFAAEALGGVGYGEGAGIGSQLVAQLIGVGAVALWSAVATVIIAMMVSLIFPMRVSEDEEREGLDITSHGERAWELD